uniref:RNA-binding protein 28 n=1 Tax=Syphacia muris TaxID=451379 RepID=A0A0N5ATW9_9BILA
MCILKEMLQKNKDRKNDEKVKAEVKTEISDDSISSKGRTIPAKQYFRDAHRKPWRLIIRNLPFNTTKEDLQVACSKYGPFTEIVLPKCKDKRYPDSCAGFAFVQFKNRQDAVKAVESLNMSEFKGRKVAIDWAIPKDTYDTAVYEEKQKNLTNEEISKPVVKLEPLDEVDANQNSYVDMKSDVSNEDDNSDDDDEDTDSQTGEKEKHNFGQDVAVTEGRVVFVRNLSYEVDNDTLKTCFEKFGEIVLAIICRFSHSDHSKGTGFVHFAKLEDADRCVEALENEPGVFIEGRRVYGCKAVPKEEAVAVDKKKLEKKPKDKRNLYLLRLGLIRRGTAAANGMSETDAAKREKMLAAAKKKLNNLHMFVSPTRLVIHNLPLGLSDKKLRSICFLAAGNPDGKIIECRIWRDKERLDRKGMGRSKGFAFVEFSTHIDALNCLKNLNNNPETFSNEKRPIVEFSIENINAVRIKENRINRNQDTSINAEKVKNEVDVQKTIKQLSSGGQKPLPSHLGSKIRKRNVVNKQQKKNVLTASDSAEQKKRKRRLISVNDKKEKSKRLKLNKSKMMTKYLALS